MTKLLPAVFERGIFRPIRPVKLPEHKRVFLTVNIFNDDIPALLIGKLAEKSGSFKYLSDPREDIYSINDGEAI
ncbi:MAG: antitoxin family protein [Candidatus Omnitrophica bacterium]|nr:antitoxin family protein [Candidatus Omnitrophota bacterium]